jgi:outer membrane cobalamin receptor
VICAPARNKVADKLCSINTTLMGDWAGATFWQNGCTGTAASLLSNGANFSKAYWLINSVKIYQ